MDLIDAHAHLHAEEFDTDLAAVVAATESAEVRAILADVTTENVRRLFLASPGRHSHGK